MGLNDVFILGEKRLFILQNWQWIGLGLSALFTVIIQIFVGIVFKILTMITKKTPTGWDNQIIQAIPNPISLIVVSGFWFFVLITLKIEGFTYIILKFIAQLSLNAGVIWTLYNLTDIVTDYVRKSTKPTQSFHSQLLPIFNNGLKALVIVLGSLITIQNLGYNVMSLIAGLGLGGLAFALAGKDTCANLLGSINILIDKPFQVGDLITIDQIEGTVEEIGLRSTRIRTFNDSIVTIPNSTMAQANIDNLGQRNYQRIKTMLTVTYDTKPEKIEEFITGIKAVITGHPNSNKDNYQVVFFGYGASALEILVNFFVKAKDYPDELEDRQKVFFDIYKLADSLGIRFAFPTQTLHIESVPKQ